MSTAIDPHHLVQTSRLEVTSRQSLLDAHMVRPAGDYNAETLEALRAFLADLAWSDHGE